LVDDLSAREISFDPIEERVLQDMLRTLLKMRRLAIDEVINDLRFFQEDSQEEGRLSEGEYMELVNQARRTRQALDQANRKLTETN
jgi:hypothetical protein